MGCGPSKTLRVSNSRNSSFDEESSYGKGRSCHVFCFSSAGDEVNTIVSRLSKDYPLSPGLNNGDIPSTKSTGGAKGRVGQKTTKLVSGPLVTPLQRTPSQIEFFRKLDEKIDKGPDLADCPEEAWPEVDQKRPS